MVNYPGQMQAIFIRLYPQLSLPFHGTRTSIRTHIPGSSYATSTQKYDDMSTVRVRILSPSREGRGHRGEQTYHFDFFADDVEGCWRTRPHASHSARSRGIGLGSCSRVRFRSFASLWELWRFRRRMVRSCIFFEVFGRGCPCFCSNRQLVCVQETYPYASITSRLPDVP